MLFLLGFVKQTSNSTNVGVFESFHGGVIEVECGDYTECNHSSSHLLSDHRLEQTLPEDDFNATDVLLILIAVFLYLFMFSVV